MKGPQRNTQSIVADCKNTNIIRTEFKTNLLLKNCPVISNDFIIRSNTIWQEDLTLFKFVGIFIFIFISASFEHSEKEMALILLMVKLTPLHDINIFLLNFHIHVSFNHRMNIIREEPAPGQWRLIWFFVIIIEWNGGKVLWSK